MSREICRGQGPSLQALEPGSTVVTDGMTPDGTVHQAALDELELSSLDHGRMILHRYRV